MYCLVINCMTLNILPVIAYMAYPAPPSSTASITTTITSHSKSFFMAFPFLGTAEKSKFSLIL